MVYNFLFVAIAALICSKDTHSKQIQVSENKVVVENSNANFSTSTSQNIYHSIQKNPNDFPSQEVFVLAYEGFKYLENQHKINNKLLTVIDFSLSSTENRFWVIDIENKKVLFSTIVAHGMNSGQEFAKSFSNKNNSFQSSLGFYLTGEIYYGKHGESLKLDGLQNGLNDNARNRDIVIHAADYVSKKHIRIHGKLGRSHGCPALPNHLNKKVIATIKDKSVLFIYHPLLKKSVKNRLIS